MIRKHFHTFDAFRFLSFFLVFLHHVPVPKTSFFSYFTKSGGIGVSFFFVLSGFLITYILLFEKKSKGKISFKKFFMRRVLRIWPLYYAMILFAMLTPFLLNKLGLGFSGDGYHPNWLMSILFLENYEMMAQDSFPNRSPMIVMWTLCIEEHFYLVWGIILSILPIKKMPHLVIGSILFASFCRIIYSKLGLADLDLFTHIDYFAFGAIPAYLLLFKHDFLPILEKISYPVKLIYTFVLVGLVFMIPNWATPIKEFFSPLILGSIFSGLIAFTLPQKNQLHIADSSWLGRLGIYTYGLYLYHTIIINLFIRLAEKLPFQLNWPTILLISLLITIVVSHFSYHLFEKQFLKMKKYFY